MLLMKKLISILFFLVVGYALFSEENAIRNSCFISVPENTVVYSIDNGNVIESCVTLLFEIKENRFLFNQ